MSERECYISDTWLDRTKVEYWVERRMLCGAPFTVADLARPIGFPYSWHTDWYVRDIVDAAAKRLKRKGLISFTRVGGMVVWQTVKAPPTTSKETGLG